MALNTTIRKLDLKANCDLSSYTADIHGYKDFAECNSLFLNKRISNWWKRKLNNKEITGSITYTADNDYFYLKENETVLGKISRDYTKIETVESDTYKTEKLSKIVNPYPQSNNNYYCFLPDGTKENPTHLTKYESGLYTLYVNIENGKLYLFKEGQRVSYVNDQLDFDVKNYYMSFLCSDEDFTFPDGTVFHTGTSPLLFFFPKNKTETIRHESIGYHAGEDVGFYWDLLYPYGSKQRILLNRRVSHSFGYTDFFGSVIPYKADSVICVFYAFDSKSESFIQAYYEEVKSNSKEKHDIDISALLDYRALVQIGYAKSLNTKTYTSLTQTYETSTVDFNYDRSEPIRIRLRWTRTDVTQWNKVLHPVNYSLAYGPWAINYVNNVAENIAYNYHKLFYLNGNENVTGEVIDIDGYNNNYIYFHSGSVYYRISIAKAEGIEEVLTNINDTFLIFSSISYLNAYHIPSGKWFCSCDDWNNRAQWYVKEYSDYWYLLNSRSGNNWQTKIDAETVSAQYASVLQRYALTGAIFSAYDSTALWDGKSEVYKNDSGDVADTSDWEAGHSLDGYYYASAFNSDASKMDVFWIDDNYTAPYYEDENGNKVKKTYDVYFGDMTQGTQSLYKQGTLSVDGFTVSKNTGLIYVEPEDFYQDNPPLLDAKYLVFSQNVTVNTSQGLHKLLTSEHFPYFLIYSTEEDTTLIEGDKEFVLNGALYIYQASNNRIIDSNGQWICNTQMFKYIGYSSRYAYFYCEFDKGLYVFAGDNTMQRISVLEKYSIEYTAESDGENSYIGVKTLNIPALDFILFCLGDRIGIIYGDQFCILNTGTINSWSINWNYGTFTVNNNIYSLVYQNLEKGNVESYPIVNVPVTVETEFYGDESGETNTINNCVYIMVDNLNNIDSGDVKLQVKGLVNNQVVDGKIKTYTLHKNDFSNAGTCGIKFQPDIQECYGFKLLITSDYEISEIKIATAPGALNQSRYRI